MLTLTLSVEAIAQRCNELNNHDSYRYIAQGDKLMLYDSECWPDHELVQVDPLLCLSSLESASPEMRKYGMPFLCF